MAKLASKRISRRKLIAIIALLAVAVWFFFAHHSDDKNSAGRGAKGVAVPISVAVVKIADIPVYLSGLGNITPKSNVTVHTRIDGQLMKVLFNEGQIVKKDGVLAQIDDRSYMAALEQAKGTLAKDEALLAEAKIDFQRYQTLWKQDSIAKQQVDTQASLVKQYEGAVENDRGLLDNAKVNLVYTKITSPVSGRAGLRQVDAGNIVHASDANGIVIVAELQPITAIFTIPEDNVASVMQPFSRNEKLVAEAWDRDNKNKLATGTLTAIDNQVDSTTGTVKCRAEFANENNALFPSQFVNIRLKLSTQKDAVTIPAAAVQRGTKGEFVYLIQPDSTVLVQKIKLGAGNGDIVSVTEGIKDGDQMVIDGTDSLRDGTKIEIANKDAKNTDEKPDEKQQHKHNKDSNPPKQ